LGAAAALNGSHCFSLAKPAASREGLIEPARVQRLTDLGHQLGLSAPEHGHAGRPLRRRIPSSSEASGQGGVTLER
jgi:hypothetical protein